MHSDVRSMGQNWNEGWATLTWFVLTARPRRELAAKDAVASLGVPAACPTRVILRRRSRSSKRKEPATYPIVPGYFFCAHPWCGWTKVLSLRDVTGVLGADGVPERIRTAELGRLMRRSFGGAMAAAEHWPVLKPVQPGDHAEVLRGPLAGQVVEVTSVHGPRAKIVSHLFGSAETDVDLDTLDAA